MKISALFLFQKPSLGGRWQNRRFCRTRGKSYPVKKTKTPMCYRNNKKTPCSKNEHGAFLNIFNFSVLAFKFRNAFFNKIFNLFVFGSALIFRNKSQLCQKFRRNS